MAKAAHGIEACFRQGKSEAGLGGYQVRNWMGDVIACLLEEKWRYNTLSNIQWRTTQWMQRNESARFYWHRARKILPKPRKELKQYRKQ